jgi:predicted RNA methylase
MSASLDLFQSKAPADKATSIVAAAKAMNPHLTKMRPIDRKMLSNTMTVCFGATDAQGAWSWRDGYDAIEATLVLQMRRLAPQIGRIEDAPVEICEILSKLSAMTPTHSVRSEEQVDMDQFSTPPALAMLTAYAAQIRPGDLVLEPSAGTGLIAAAAEACGAKIHINELSKRRLGILKGLFPEAIVTSHDAALISDLSSASGSFNAVLTNPPFSYLVSHLKASMMALATGGRLVAVVPTRVFDDRDILNALTKFGAVTGMIGLPVNAFAKHGTSVETGLLIVDRGAAKPETPTQAVVCLDLEEVCTAIKGLTPRLNLQVRTFRAVATGSLTTIRPTSRQVPSHRLTLINSVAPVSYQPIARSEDGEDAGIYQTYTINRLKFAKANRHPAALVESASMANITLPGADYIPDLPVFAIEHAVLSDEQLETIIYAGQAHSDLLPGQWNLSPDNPHDVTVTPQGETGIQYRKGFFLGDGTGCGKGRQVAGVIADNMAKGRLKAVWVSKNEPLLEDARRDWRAIGGADNDITPQSSFKQGDEIRIDKGILFTTYATLRQQPSRGRPSRLQQIVNWLKSDFDGVIAFDEAHAAANAAGGKAGRGKKAASQQGMAVLALQNILHDARILYVSATGATTPENLAYAARLGLWGGPEAPFNTRSEFLEKIEAGGICTMEIVARELKAMGLYIARSLSFNGVEYDPLTHDLTEEDVFIWDQWADAFQKIHANLEQAIEATIREEDGKSSGQAKSAAKSAFEGAKLRFFAHLLAGLKAPTLISSIRKDLENGHSAIVQIVSTNEAVMERRLAEIPTEEWSNLAIDMTPKEYVLDYLRHAFPTTLMCEIEDADGNKTMAPVMNDGQAVESQEALALREELLFDLGCLPAVQGVLDGLIQSLGTDVVAEVTGRSRRIINNNGRKMVQRRGANANTSETDAFMNGAKRVLIFSDAGGTGRSYHADLNCNNTSNRIHYLVEPGWRADNAIQGLGRSHRTNQKSAPLFRPVTTNIQGEKRFLSTIARRLDSLGALTKGERRTGTNGLFKADDNLESPWARRALSVFYVNLFMKTLKCMTIEEFETKTALKIQDGEGSLREAEQLPPMNTFLNRVLALRIEDQNSIFEDFTSILNDILMRAEERGDIDQGIEDIVAEDIQIVSDEIVRTDPKTLAETHLVSFNVRTKRQILSRNNAFKHLHKGSYSYVINSKSQTAAVVIHGETMTGEDDRLVESVRVVTPLKSTRMTLSAYNESAWDEVDVDHWEMAWDQVVATTDPYHTRTIILATGILLPIWNLLPSSQARIRRIKAPDGSSWLGRVIDDVAVSNLKRALGIWSTDTTLQNPNKIENLVAAGSCEVRLGNDLWLRRARVMDHWRIEIVNANYNDRSRLTALGCFVDIIRHTPRLFLPKNKPDVLKSVLKAYPAMELHSSKIAA